MVDGIMWLSVWGARPASPLITRQDQRAISWGGGGGWEVFSVPVSLHQHQRKISMPCFSVWVCKWVYLPLLLPVWAWKLALLRRGRGGDVVIVTVSRLIGHTVLVIDAGERCGVCADWDCQMLKVFDEAVRGSRTRGHLGPQSSPSGTVWESFWTGSSSLSSWSKPARLMFIHYTSVLSPAESVLSVLATLMFQTPH